MGLGMGVVFLRTEAAKGLGEDEEGRWGSSKYLLMMVGRKHKKNLSGMGMKGSSPR